MADAVPNEIAKCPEHKPLISNQTYTLLLLPNLQVYLISVIQPRL